MHCCCPVTKSFIFNSFETAWTIAYQAPRSMGFCRQEYWSGLPFPSPGNLCDLGIEPTSPTLADKFFTTVLIQEAQKNMSKREKRK